MAIFRTNIHLLNEPQNLINKTTLQVSSKNPIFVKIYHT